ncbi:hypothetical protein HXP44_19995 [Streptomyces sioyaensis]|uniref:Uncharacterized protein n=1 Tax=Streptomyces sioyaensis TaxID=67364 RepID=A0A4V1NPS4_9ACTN|nr:hypothetical protein [Streptomyces sioyaensis]MBM4794289.1 hypothetical protein [Streptomyces sioyaensis]RXS65830.1 hypothetical protein EST54_17255 [Streptomyces sioyaensis]
MAFSADELRVLRRALAHALETTSHPAPLPVLGPEWSQDIQEYLRLAEAVDEAVREGGRLRAFLLADLDRYRAALPGSAVGYLAQLTEALAAGHVPGPDDLAALRSLCALPATLAECERRRALLRHCEQLAEHSVRARLRALPGGRSASLGGREREPEREPEPERKPEPAPAPAPHPKGPRPGRPIPTPGEVFPPRRKPAPPPESRTA